MIKDSSPTQLFQKSQSSPAEELLILHIELPESNTQILTIYNSDNTQDTINEFCVIHGIGPVAQAYLEKEVNRSLHFYYPPEDQGTLIDSELAEQIDKNKGQDLYSKGQKQKEKTDKKREDIRKDRLQKEIENTTFNPRVNSPDRRAGRPEDILLEKGKLTYESLNKKRVEQDQVLMKECSFSPAINKNSGNMKKSLMRSPNRFNTLYQDAKSIQDKLQKKSEELNKMACPFEPNFEKTKKKNKQILEKPSKNSSLERRDIEFKNVYSEVEGVQANNDTLKKEEKKVTDKSEKMIRKIKKTRFEEIFNELKPDLKGRIYKESIYRSSIDERVRNIIKPVLEKLENSEVHMGLEEFCREMEELFGAIPQVDKSVLLRTGKKKLSEDEIYANHNKRPSSCTSYSKEKEQSFRSNQRFN